LSSIELGGQATQFIESVLQLKPAIAVFDCDGTLWSGDAGADFFYWEMARGLVSREIAEWARARYKEYEAGNINEEQMCGEMVTMNRGLKLEGLRRAAAEFYDEVVRHREFPEMRELVTRLRSNGCDVWAVSSTNNWVVEVGASSLGIAPDHVLAACVYLDDGHATDRLVRVPTDELKAVAIREVIGKPIDAVFGNSVHDLAMLEMARFPICVNPNPDLEKIARERGWPVYRPVVGSQ
jgi:phosphoserine phosphatase